MPGEISAQAVSALATVAPEPGAPKPEPLLVADGVNRHFGKIKRADAVKTGHIHPEQAGVRPTLMMGIDTASLAEIMLRRAGIELIKRQIFFAHDELNARQGDRNRNRAAHPAI